MNSRTIEILLVEDNAGDVRLTLEAFKEAKVLNNFQVVSDGAEALEYLRQEGPYANSALPDLILLDLNLPKKDGREVLAEIKADERLKRIPVVVLTTSAAEDDIARAYACHANCYINKPVDLDQFLRVVHSIATRAFCRRRSRKSPKWSSSSSTVEAWRRPWSSLPGTGRMSVCWILACRTRWD